MLFESIMRRADRVFADGMQLCLDVTELTGGLLRIPSYQQEDCRRLGSRMFCPGPDGTRISSSSVGIM